MFPIEFLCMICSHRPDVADLDLDRCLAPLVNDWSTRERRCKNA